MKQKSPVATKASFAGCVSSGEGSSMKKAKPVRNRKKDMRGYVTRSRFLRPKVSMV